MKEGHDLLSKFGVLPLMVTDASVGGTTDAQHLLGFGSNFCTPQVPSIEQGLQRTICHVLDGRIKGWFPMVLKALIPPLVNPARAVLWHNKIIRPESLFPCHARGSKVYCLLHKLRSCRTVRELTIHEQFCLYQMPLAMDSVLEGLNPAGWLPFKDAPLPED
jgi:hypothetical protein